MHAKAAAGALLRRVTLKKAPTPREYTQTTAKMRRHMSEKLYKARPKIRSNLLLFLYASMKTGKPTVNSIGMPETAGISNVEIIA